MSAFPDLKIYTDDVLIADDRVATGLDTFSRDGDLGSISRGLAAHRRVGASYESPLFHL